MSEVEDEEFDFKQTRHEDEWLDSLDTEPDLIVDSVTGIILDTRTGIVSFPVKQLEDERNPF